MNTQHGNVTRSLPKGGRGWLPLLLLILHPVILTKGELEDTCDVFSPSIYCNCEFRRSDEGRSLNCYVGGPLTPRDGIWEEIGFRNATYLGLVCKLGSELDFVPVAALGALPDLRALRFRQARLGSLSSGSFSNNRLVDIDLSSNEIERLEPAAFVSMENLERLSLTDNLITKIEKGSFVRLPKLRDLFLDGNQIVTIQSGSFEGLSGLVDMILSSNNLTRLEEGTFKGLTRLDFLDLFRNQITELPENAFLPLSNLSRLDLSRNRISSIHPSSFRGLNHLTVLLLNYNKLQTLPNRLFMPVPQLRQIGLDFNLLHGLSPYLLSYLDRRLERDFIFRFKENPLRCNCGLWWTATHYLNNSQSLLWKKQLRHVKCSFSDSVAGGDTQRVMKLASDEVGCGNDTAKYLEPPDFAEAETIQRDQNRERFTNREVRGPNRIETNDEQDTHSRASSSTRNEQLLAASASVLVLLIRNLS
ncbi:decorin-like [Centruroides sculpturatus]|uniref:decorin-like n=1 Tax=Centruroides sculpturatus TaxID=218467 RepID=UPI000C6E1708|nr:decorin-like [Centruroides sculpturatus]